MARQYYQGRFKPKNYKKYKGNPTQIVYRSSYELKFMKNLDDDPNVVEWQSEEMFVPYISPVDNKCHRYFVDFIYKIKINNTTHTVMAEIKPKIQTSQPKKNKNGKITKRFLNETVTFAVNEAKWKAAREYCADRNWTFKIITEKELNIING